MSRKAKNKMFMVIMFSAFAILFAILHVVGIIKKLDSYLAMTYMTYFLGLAFMYLGSYQKLKEKYSSMRWCFAASIVLILASIVFLIYGLATGEITLFL